MQVLKHAGGQAGGGKRFGVSLGYQWRLLRHLEEHRVAGQQCGDDRVHRREPGIVPRRQHEDDAERLAPDETMEVPALFDLDVGKRGRRDLRHVCPALLKAATQLERGVRDGASHLRRDLRAQLVGARDAPLNCSRTDGRSLGYRHLGPPMLRLHGARERQLDLGVGRE